MPWYNKLLSLFPELKNIIVNLNIASNNRNKKIVRIDKSKHVTINLPKLGPEEKEQLKSVLSDAKEEGVVLLKEDSKALIEDFRSEDKTQDTQNSLSFLKPLVPPKDIIMWRAALYLRKKHDRGEKKDVARLKKEISERHGRKGNNIANLCTAGYLETLLMPLYNSLEEIIGDKKEIKERFLRIYFDIVTYLPFTIFVYYQMKKEDVENEILARVKYGVKFINIHGIGENNVSKIKEAITKIEEKTLTANKHLSEGNNIIFARLEFKEQPPEMIDKPSPEDNPSS